MREIERRIQKVEAMNTSGEQRALPGAPAGVPDAYDEHVKLMMDLQVLAFQSDLTRVFAFKLSRDVSNRVYPETGVTTGFHIASHHGEREDRIIDFAKINRYHVGLVPYLLEKLKNDARRRQRHAARQLAHLLRVADGQPQRAQPQALPVVHRRPRRRRRSRATAHQAPPTARRWPTRCSSMLRTFDVDDAGFGDSKAEMDLNGVADTTVERR